MAKHSSAAIYDRTKKGIEYALTHRSALISRPVESDILALINPETTTLDQAVYLPFFMRELGAVGYDNVSITNETDLHRVHRRFRNEWWNLAGKRAGDQISLQIWRHTLVPPTLWEAHETTYSVVWFSWTVNGNTQHSPFFLEHWGLAGIRANQGLFEIHCGALNFLKSKQSDSLFPMDLQWLDVRLENLDNTRPMVMLHSNACLSCSDGIGIKMYMYPKVENSEFSGYFSHAWESGVLPEGFSSNVFMRGYSNIDRTLWHVPAGGKSDQWLTIYAQLENQHALWAFFVSHTHKHPHRAVLSNPDGSMTRLTNVELILQDGLSNAVIKHANFSLQWIVELEHNPSYGGITVLSHGQVSGVWKQGFVHGIVTIETPDPRPYHERAAELLRDVFHSPESKFDREYFNSTSDSQDVLTSVAIWLLPVLFGTVLLMCILYLVLTRNQRYPWIQSRRKTWW